MPTVYAQDASDAAEALEALHDTKYDAVLLDIQMPAEDGISVARKVRGFPGLNQNIPIIGVSAFSSVAENEGVFRLFTQLLAKPVRNAVLHDALLQAFAHQSYKTEGPSNDVS